MSKLKIKMLNTAVRKYNKWAGEKAVFFNREEYVVWTDFYDSKKENRYSDDNIIEIDNITPDENGFISEQSLEMAIQQKLSYTL